MSYTKLEIWELARDLSVEIHKMTIELLPNFEKYEEGAQIRRSIKSVRSNIVEGYGRRRYKQEFIRFLTYAHASCDETLDHLKTLYQTGSLADGKVYQQLEERISLLGKRLYFFIKGVDSQHQSGRDDAKKTRIG